MSSGAISDNIQRKAPPWQESSKGPATKGCNRVVSRGSAWSWNDSCGGDSAPYHLHSPKGYMEHLRPIWRPGPKTYSTPKRLITYSIRAFSPDIYAGLTDNEFRRYQRQYPEESSTMAGVIERARDEGMQQGMRQGRVEGERAVLERLLRRRFGLLSTAVAERLSQASASDLETWAENVLDAETLDDVFNSSS